MTIDDLIAGVNGKAKGLFEFYDPTKQYYYSIDNDRIYLSVNQAVPANHLTWISSSQYPHFVPGAPGLWQGNGSFGFQRFANITDFQGNLSGHLVIKGRRQNVANLAIFMALSQSGSNFNKVIVGQKGNTGPRANDIFVERWGSAAINAGSFVTGQLYNITTVGTTNFTLIGAAASTLGTYFIATGPGSGTGAAVPVNCVGYTNNDTNLKIIDIITDSSAYDLQLARVSQSKNLGGGAIDNGDWFGDLTSPNRGNVGICEATTNQTARQELQFLGIFNAPLTTPERDVVAAYMTERGL